MKYKNDRMGKIVKKVDNSQSTADARGLLKSFNDQTTFHGIRYAFGSDRSWTQRIVWSVLILACAGLVIFDVADRIIYYNSSPKSINLDMVHPKSLLFPAVTICNQNAFRRTLAKQNAHYRLLTKLFRDGKPQLDELSEEEMNITLKALYTANAHRKEDMIVQCKWKSQDCGPGNFTTVLTRYGQCYTFNGMGDEAKYLESPGVANGLELIINAEEYDYMVGPHNAGGIKIQLHGREEFPMPMEYGYELPTGRHGFMDVKVYKEIELPPPEGHCHKKSGHYFDKFSYTHGTCTMKQQSSYVMEKCGCREFFIPSGQGDNPVCTLENLDCQLQAKSDFQEHENAIGCMTPCTRLRYQPFLSYGSISVFARNKLNLSVNNDLKTRFIKAREMAFDEEEGHTKLNMYLERLLYKEFPAFATTLSAFDYIDSTFTKCSADANRLTTVYFTQAINLLQGSHPLYMSFQYAKSVLAYGPFGVTHDNINEFFNSLQNQLYQIKELSLTSKSRSSYIKMAEEILDEKIKIVKDLEGINEYARYINSLYPDIWIKDLDNYTNDVQLLIQDISITRDIYSQPKSFDPSEILNTLSTATRHLNTCLSIVDEVANTGNLNVELFNTTKSKLKRLVKRYEKELKVLDTFYNHIISNFQHLSKLMTLVQSAYSEISDDLKKECNYMRYTKDINNAAKSIFNMTFMLYRYTRIKDVSITDMSRYYLNSDLSYSIENLKGFATNAFGEMQNSVTPVSCLAILVNTYEAVTYWHSLILPYLQSLPKSAESKCIKDKGRIYDFLKSYTFNAKAWHDVLFTTEQIQETATDFLDSIKMGRSFYRENFLHLNVLFQELNYQQTTQQVAYDFFGLLGDIGGALGLFIGASVLTIFEVADLLFQIFYTRMSRKQKVGDITYLRTENRPQIIVREATTISVIHA